MSVLRNIHVQHVDELDHLRDVVRDADAEFTQLAPGRLHAELLRANVAGLIYDFQKVDLTVRGRGGSSTHWLTFVAPEVPNTLNGHLVKPGQLFLFRPGTSYEGVHPRGTRNHLFTMRLGELADFAERHGYRIDCQRVAANDLPGVDPAACRRLQELGRSLVGSIHSNPAILDCPASAGALREEFLIALCQAIGGQPAPPGVTERDWSHQQYCRWVSQADAMLAQSAEQPLAVAAICASLGVAPRTLTHAFKQVVGVSVGHYLQCQRLAAVRRALRNAAPEQSVTAIAMEHGFWHLGRFSIAYRRFYGELPSHTLRRRDRH